MPGNKQTHIGKLLQYSQILSVIVKVKVTSENGVELSVHHFDKTKGLRLTQEQILGIKRKRSIFER